MSPRATAAVVEDVVVRGLGLAAREVREVRAEGELRGAPVALVGRVHEGAGRVVIVEGRGLAFANVLFARGAAPVLGIDLVSVGDGTLVAADLTPVLPVGTAERAEQTARIARVRAAHPPLPSAGPLSPPYDELLSPHCVHARVTGPEDAARASLVLRELAEVFVAFASAPARPDLAPATERGLAAYMVAHRKDVRVVSVLARAFGAAFAEPFVRDVLFPVPASLES